MTMPPEPLVRASAPSTEAPISEQAATPAPEPQGPRTVAPISEQPGAAEPQPQAPEPVQPSPAFGATSPVTSATAPSVSVTDLSKKIATAISLGLAAPPTSAAGWAQLMDAYSTPQGEFAIANAQAQAQVASQTSASPQGTSSPPGGVNAFLAAIRQHESGGNYTAHNPAGGASGAYQFIQSTWANAAVEAGFGQYAGEPAAAAPPAVQDAVAAHMAQGYYTKYGNWKDAAEAWYYPALAGSPAAQTTVPVPGAGNTETVGQYGDRIVAAMGLAPQQDASSPTAGNATSVVKIAQSQLGTPYVWGGEDPMAPGHSGAFDCSGFVQWTYGQAGVHLPRVAQAQYDATAKVPAGAQLQAGDLVFFGRGPKDITHVGIYIGGGNMIDAPHAGAEVRVENANWADYVGATRPGDPNGATTIAQAAQLGNQSAQAITNQNQENYGALLSQVSQAIAQVQGFYPSGAEVVY